MTGRGVVGVLAALLIACTGGSNWNRHYDPSTGRYLSPEPLLQNPRWVVAQLQQGHQVSAYGYANNNPIVYVDPNGLSPLTQTIQQLPPPAYPAIVAVLLNPVGLALGVGFAGGFGLAQIPWPSFTSTPPVSVAPVSTPTSIPWCTSSTDDFAWPPPRHCVFIGQVSGAGGMQLCRYQCSGDPTPTDAFVPQGSPCPSADSIGTVH
jgi:RHS repeat-associated protein